jgi:hypothetical protein
MNESLGAVGFGLVHVAAPDENVSQGEVRLDVAGVERGNAGPKRLRLAPQTMTRGESRQLDERRNVALANRSEPGSILGQCAVLPFDPNHAVARHADFADTDVDRDGGARLPCDNAFKTAAAREVKDIRAQGGRKENGPAEAEQTSWESRVQVHGKPPNPPERARRDYAMVQANHVPD